jgi:hypothetical protein
VAADGAFECVLGLVVVACAAGGWLGAGDFAGVPAGVLVALGAALVVIGAALGYVALARPVSGALLHALALGNLVSGLVLVACAAAAGFSSAGWAVAALTAAGLVVLAGAELLAYPAVPARRAATYQSSSGSNMP